MPVLTGTIQKMKYIKTLLNKDSFFKTVIFIFLISLFFPIRHVFLAKEAYLTGTYSDFTSFSLYLSDILIFLLALITFLPRGGKIWLKIKAFKFKISELQPPTSNLSLPICWLILAIFVIFIIHFSLNMRLNGYLLIKWLELLVSYGTFRLLFEQNSLKSLFLKLFIWFCALESIIALAQFAKQSSLGLYRLGESHIAPNILGVAKIVSGGTTYIRVYGTFPHPNPFSAFLVAGILICSYLLVTSVSKKVKITYSILLFINILGLTVTFSRGAYLALAAGLLIFFSFFLWRHPEGVHPTEGSQTKRFFPRIKCGVRMTPVIVVLISILISFFLLKPFLLTRATFSDQSTINRKFYDVTGIKMTKKNPWFGVGLGESLFHMEQYLPLTNFHDYQKPSTNFEEDINQKNDPDNQKFVWGSGKALQPWDKQPPHNYFILAAAELGIPAMLILLWIFLSHLWGLTKKIRLSFSPYLYSLFSILFAFLLLMQFDHYFYTLQQTQMLLWIILGIIAAETKNPSSKKEESEKNARTTN